jgi:hypothetical protein
MSRTATLRKPQLATPVAPAPAPQTPAASPATETPDEGVRFDRWALWFWLFGAAILILWHVGDFLYGLWLR